MCVPLFSLILICFAGSSESASSPYWDVSPPPSTVTHWNYNGTRHPTKSRPDTSFTTERHLVNTLMSLTLAPICITPCPTLWPESLTSSPPLITTTPNRKVIFQMKPLGSEMASLRYSCSLPPMEIQRTRLLSSFQRTQVRLTLSKPQRTWSFGPMLPWMLPPPTASGVSKKSQSTHVASIASALKLTPLSRPKLCAQITWASNALPLSDQLHPCCDSVARLRQITPNSFKWLT